jgi:hypothetical protein
MDEYEVTISAYKACVDVHQCTAPALNTLGGFITHLTQNSVNWVNEKRKTA